MTRALHDNAGMPLVTTPPPLPNDQLEVAFEATEYARRLESVRQRMAEDGLDLLLVTYINNACYLTGYQTPLANWYVCIAVPIEGELVAHVLDLELTNLYLHGWTSDPVYVLNWWDEDRAADELADIVKTHGWSEKRIGLEIRRDGCLASFAQTLAASLPQAQLVDASDVVLASRVIKSELELGCMRAAARLSDVGIGAALAEVREGKTDGDVVAAAYDAMSRAGSEYLTIQPLAYAGRSQRLSHLGAKRRVMQPGAVFSMEMTGVYQRYSAPIFRTATFGAPSDDVKRLLDTADATLEKMFEIALPGTPASEITKELKALAASKLDGLVAPRDLYGYAVGIGFPPDWVEHSMYITEREERTLQAGMTFHSPHGFRVRDKGTGAAFSETWVVTENGGKRLTQAPRELVVVD